MHRPEYQQTKMLAAPAAAAYCGSSESTFAKLRLYGGGPVYVKLGRRVVYDPADLDHWLASHRRASTSEEEAASARTIFNLNGVRNEWPPSFGKLCSGSDCG